MSKKLTHRILLSLLLTGLLLLFSEPSAAQVEAVVVEVPQLSPPYNNDCPESYWYAIQNNRGFTSYLTLNADLANSTNSGEWHPVIPQAGYYKVEAYIPTHAAIIWCVGQNPPTIQHDTTEARYTIHHGEGVTNRSMSQYPLGNQWLNLGEYYFNAGQTGYVHLTDLNGEQKFTTTISFSAMRFTFTRLTRPKSFLPAVQYSAPPGQVPPRAGVLRGQGFDACHLPEISEMQSWWSQSPYYFYALYLGGISLYHECSVANSYWVNTVHQQGWSFVPTWVGPQAPCSTYLHRMSSDSAVAYQEGRQEAQSASAAAASLGLTNNDWGGTVIYYDMEVYGGASQACRQTVASFMNGWVERLHEIGNIAGGYGSRYSYITDWATVAHVPNDVWAASWYTTIYDPYATVNNITWLEGLWTNHQRLRQYTGGHNETWGSKTFNIDSNVADGMVALPPGRILSDPIVTTAPSIDDSGWLSAQQGWLVSENRLYLTSDRGKNWQDISPGSIQLAHILPSGEAWAVFTRDGEQASLYHSTDWGKNWKSSRITLPPGSWLPLQLHFTSPASGWLVLQKVTSQAFDIGSLLKTTDGGLTWQAFNLPAAAPIQFTSAMEGWLSDRSGKLYRTLDGGLTWQPRRQDQNTIARHTLPSGTTASGWQTNDLGWAATSTSSCSGDKFEPGFTCHMKNSLWQTVDAGVTWQDIPIPELTSSIP